MQCEEYLCFGGIELANSNRTLAYLRAGLGGSAFEVHGLAGSAGYCEAYDEGPYESPSADSAPWYLSTKAESTEFLGLLLTSIELQPVLTRAVTARGPRGASLGSLYPKQRVVSCQGTMTAASAKGMEWGQRWVNEVLLGDCDDLVDALILPACPPITDQDRFFRTLRRVGVVDGPTFTAIQGVPACSLQGVAFQLVAEVPDLLAPPAVLGSGTLTSGQSLSAEASTEEWIGDAAVRITIDPSTDLASWTIRAVPMAAGQECPTSGANPCAAYDLASLPALDKLVIDPTVREVAEFDITSKRWVSGFGRLGFDGLFDWIEVPPCSNVCVTVTSGTGTADVTIEQIDREF